MEPEPLRLVLGAEDRDRIGGHRRRRRDLGQEPAVGPPEPERAIRLAIDPITLLVDRPMVPATQQREVRQRGRAAFGLVAHVMAFTQRQPAAREAAALVAMV